MGYVTYSKLTLVHVRGDLRDDCVVCCIISFEHHATTRSCVESGCTVKRVRGSWDAKCRTVVDLITSDSFGLEVCILCFHCSYKRCLFHIHTKCNMLVLPRRM